MELTFFENNLPYTEYSELRESVGWNLFSEEQTKQALKRSFYSVLIKAHEKPIAMGRVVGDGIYFTIVDVIVRPEFQGKGLGSQIMDMLLKEIEASLPRGSRASIQLISEIGKEAFYLKQGFKLVPHEFCGSALRKVIYGDRKSLPL